MVYDYAQIEQFKSTPSRLFELVFHGGVDEELIESGQVPRGWIDKYWSSFESAIAEFRRMERWQKSDFQALHFASMYLPLRYLVWTDLSARRQPQTESILYQLSSRTEELLWSAVADHPIHPNGEGGLSKSAFGVIDLCFNSEDILGDQPNPFNLTEWRVEYSKCLSDVSTEYFKSNTWPAWLCMAVHFASFYIDLLEVKNISIGAVREETIVEMRIDTLLGKLVKYIHSQTAIELIRLWLESAKLLRDHNGVPMLPGANHVSHQSTSVRTPSEIFLLGRRTGAEPQRGK